jgi:hypothetical protein
MEVFNYCNQCKKSLDCTNFDKKNGKYYTRCKVCRKNHNDNERNKYVKKCTNRSLCNKEECTICYSRSFASYESKTANGKLKVNCWHYTKNGGLTPRDVFMSSHKKFWFQCDVCTHDFDSSLCNTSGKNRWCPYCCISVRKLCNEEECTHCYNKSFDSYKSKTVNGKLKVDCWHPTKNNKLTPRDVSKGTPKKYWFQCDVCTHDFDSSLAKISGLNTWCPYCSQKICNEEECTHCYNNSFASYKNKTANGKLKVTCWHSTKNNKLTPRDVAMSSNKKYWFQCDVCTHDFNSSLAKISGSNRWCPYCSQKICNKEECTHCYNKSFASYENKTANGKLKVDCWHSTKNGGLTPRDVSKGTKKKYWFQCDVCDHDFNSQLASISGLNSWCPYCPAQKLCDEEECTHCYNNSFASYESKTANGKLKVDCWHSIKNGDLTPRDVFMSSGKKYWFQCDVCTHDFDSSLSNISGKNRWCPHCKNKTELKLYNWLLEQNNIKNVKREFKPKWCSTEFRQLNKKKELKNGIYQYRYDFLITFNNKKQLLIELDGEQHSKQVSNWKSPFEHQIRDKYKTFLARKQKIRLIRCTQIDVYFDKNNWDRKLKKQLKHMH